MRIGRVSFVLLFLRGIPAWFLLWFFGFGNLLFFTISVSSLSFPILAHLVEYGEGNTEYTHGSVAGSLFPRFPFFVFFFYFLISSSPKGPERWRLTAPLVHQFFVRTNSQVYRIFGMTGRIIVDAARVAYAQEPEFEHNSHFGDEEMISKLRRLGRLSAVRKSSDQLTRQTMEKAAKLS